METSIHYISDASATGTRKVALTIKGKPRENQEPAHLNILLDTSGSMEEGRKLATCKRSIGFILDMMRDQDAVSLVTFDDDAAVISKLVETKPANKLNFMTLVNAVRIGGCTNMSAGILEGQNLLEPAGSRRKQGMLLLTDGNANRGVYSADSIFGIVKTVMESNPGLTVHTVGYGFDHNVGLLSKIGEWTGGTYSVVKNLEDVATVFGAVLGSMVSTTAQNVKVTLPPGFKLLSQISKDTDEAGATVVRVGDIQSEVSSIILFEVPVNSTLGVSLSGFDLLENATVRSDLAIGPLSTMTEEASQNLNFALLRLDLVELMKDVQGKPSSDAIPGLLSRLDALYDRLKTAPVALCAMLAVMEHDITMMRNILMGTSRNCHAEQNLLSQHSAVYSAGRGLMSSEPADDSGAYANAAVASPFISRTTSRYVGAMRTASHVPSNEEDEDPSMPMSRTRVRRQQALAFATNEGSNAGPMSPRRRS